MLFGWNAVITVWLIFLTSKSYTVGDRAEKANEKAEMLDSFLGCPLYQKGQETIPEQLRTAKSRVDNLAKKLGCEWHSATKYAGVRKIKAKAAIAAANKE